jgi:hypothetical protein
VPLLLFIMRTFFFGGLLKVKAISIFNSLHSPLLKFLNAIYTQS